MLSCPRCLHPTLPEHGETTCTNCGRSYHWHRATNTIVTELTDVLRPERAQILLDWLQWGQYALVRSM